MRKYLAVIFLILTVLLFASCKSDAPVTGGQNLGLDEAENASENATEPVELKQYCRGSCCGTRQRWNSCNNDKQRNFNYAYPKYICKIIRQLLCRGNIAGYAA